MARTSDPHSASSQFFINLVDNLFLDFNEETSDGWGYAVFGEVIDGQKQSLKLEKFKQEHVVFSDVPVKPTRYKRSKAEITC